MRTIDVIDALKSLAPGASWEYSFDTETLTWFSDDIEKPTRYAIDAEIARLIEVAEAEEAARVEADSAREAAKQSALAKLALLGLTEEEARAVIGLE